ncbi:MAG: NAD-dependent epimerase/dehydratase family protein [Actinobacteria bacterium]|nr:NAD-dependent epimerase/dehydratase family protein [Actinomycetota bacterium]
MTTLVTGATGFLGSRVARQLVEGGEPVRVLARSTSNLRRLEEFIDKVEVVEGDVTDRTSVEGALIGCDRVIHCAGVYEFGTRDPAYMALVNVTGTQHVLETAATQGAAAVHVSSAIALGPTGPQPSTEDHWVSVPTRSPYAVTKREGHEVARRLIKDGADLRIVAPTTIYGPDDPSLVGLLHRIAARAPLPLAAFPEMRMTLVHVDDCAQATIAGLAAPSGEEFVVGGQVVTFRDWFTALARAAERRHGVAGIPDGLLRAVAPLVGALSRTGREGLALADGSHWAFNSEKARATLEWEARPLDDGLTETLAWYRAHRPGRAATRRTVNFGFVEVMSGSAQMEGERFDRPFRFEFDVEDGRLADYFTGTATGRAIGRVSLDGIATDVTAEGVLELSPYRNRTIRYAFDFTADDGRPLRFDGHKTIVHWKPVSSWTRLPGRLFDADGRVVGDAFLRFDLRDEFVNLARSFHFSRVPD